MGKIIKKKAYLQSKLEITRGFILFLTVFLPICLSVFINTTQHDKEFYITLIDNELQRSDDYIETLKTKLDLINQNKVIVKGGDIIYPGYNSIDTTYPEILKKQDNWLYNENIDPLKNQIDILRAQIIFEIEHKRSEKMYLFNRKLDLINKDGHMIYYLTGIVAIAICVVGYLILYSGSLIRKIHKED